MLTANEIKEKGFDKAMRGYNPDQVDDFLDEMIASVEEYDAKVRRLKSEIAEGNANLHKLRKEYTAFVQNEQRETLTALLFNGNLSPAEVTKAIAAITALFQGNANHENAIRRLQEIADAQQNSTIAHFVSELEAQETQPTQNQIRGLGDSSQAAEQ